MLIFLEKYSWINLIALYILIAAVLALRISVEATNYTSSDPYMHVAENLSAAEYLKSPQDKADKNSQNNVPEAYFTMWPIGYPLVIAGVMMVSDTSSLIASKIVNFSFLGLIFLLLYIWFGHRAWFPALTFCSFGLLEVFSYTWSEGPFLFFVLLLCYYLEKSIAHEDNLLFLKLAFCLISLFLLRYAGLIYFLFVGFWLLWLLQKKQYLTSLHLFFSLLLATSVVLAYLFINKQKSGFYTGGERIFPDMESVPFFLELLYQGLINEFFIIRKYFFRGFPDYLFLALIAIQFALILYCWIQSRHQEKPIIFNPANVLLQASIFYLVTIIIIRKISPFETFNYRILSPFSSLLFIYILTSLTKEYNLLYFRKVAPWITAFMLLSLLANLPKQYIIEQFLS